MKHGSSPPLPALVPQRIPSTSTEEARSGSGAPESGGGDGDGDDEEDDKGMRTLHGLCEIEMMGLQGRAVC